MKYMIWEWEGHLTYHRFFWSLAAAFYVAGNEGVSGRNCCETTSCMGKAVARLH